MPPFLGDMEFELWKSGLGLKEATICDSLMLFPKKKEGECVDFRVNGEYVEFVLFYINY